MQKEYSVIELAQQLVRINSVTPGADQQGPVAGEKRLAEFLCDFLTPYGFDCELDMIKADRPNLYARHGDYNPDLPTLAFEAHLDTVGVDHMSIDPFKAEIQAGRLYGRGACDTKGTMAAMLHAMLKWYGRRQAKSFNLIFIGSMGEELGTIGAKALVKKSLALDMVLVGEPTHCIPVVVHNGLWRFKLSTKGKACHSSNPLEGENAIEKMHSIFNLVLSEFKPSFEKPRGNTFSVTQLHGGTMMNIIPDYCYLVVDARYGPETDLSFYKNTLFSSLQEMKKYQYEEIQQEPAFESKGKLLHLMDKALYDLGMESTASRQPWFSDAAHFSHSGYDCVVWGAGSIQQAHTKDEYIAVEQLTKAVDILNRLLIHCQEYYHARS